MRFGPPSDKAGRSEQAVQLARSLVFAVMITTLLFLVLPVMQHVGRPPRADSTLREVDTVHLPPPPPPPRERDEPRREETPPELVEAAPPLALRQIELALDPGLTGTMDGDFALRLPDVERATQEALGSVFSFAELDQPPRVIHQPAPDYPPELRRRNVEGTVHVLFVVDRQGRTLDPVVQEPADPALAAPAVRAVRRWRFEPGTRHGEPVRFEMRVPITFVSD